MSKNFSKTGVIIPQVLNQALATLSPNVAIKISTPIVLGADFKMLKTEVFATVDTLTAGEGHALLFGLANNDLTVTEIKEALEVNGPTDRNARIEIEQSGRAVFLMGAVDLNTQSTTDLRFRDKIAAGFAMILKPRWRFAHPEGWTWFVYNAGKEALTTGAIVRLNAKSWGLWLD